MYVCMHDCVTKRPTQIDVSDGAVHKEHACICMCVVSAHSYVCVLSFMISQAESASMHILTHRAI